MHACVCARARLPMNKKKTRLLQMWLTNKKKRAISNIIYYIVKLFDELVSSMAVLCIINNFENRRRLT